MNVMIFIILIWVVFGYFAKKMSFEFLRMGFSDRLNKRFEKRDRTASWFISILGPFGLLVMGIAWLVMGIVWLAMRNVNKK